MYTLALENFTPAPVPIRRSGPGRSPKLAACRTHVRNPSFRLEVKCTIESKFMNPSMNPKRHRGENPLYHVPASSGCKPGSPS